MLAALIERVRLRPALDEAAVRAIVEDVLDERQRDGQARLDAVFPKMLDDLQENLRESLAKRGVLDQ